MTLVDYTSSDEESTCLVLEQETSMESRQVVPSLPAAFSDLYQVEPRRGDDPEFHQGRIRVHEHVAGDWPTHIYLDFLPSSSLRTSFQHVLQSQELRACMFHSLLSSEMDVHRDLHISLSRPLMLRTESKAAVLQDLVKIKHNPVTLQFDALTVFVNQEKTREFLVATLSEQASQAVERLYAQINDVLTQHNLPILYGSTGKTSRPEANSSRHGSPLFHASIAWRPYTGTDTAQYLSRLKMIDVHSLEHHKIECKAFKVKIGKDITVVPLTR